MSSQRNGCDWTYEKYGELIDALRSRCYVPCFFGEKNGADRALYLRHDVDLCLERAVHMAAVEQLLGVKSTYFVMLRSEFYNLLSEAGRGAVKMILAFGHRIGLHYYPGDADRYEISRDCAVIRQALGVEIQVASAHKPTKFPGPAFVLDRRVVNAYGPSFVSGYSSDSTGVWRYVHPLDSPWVTAGISGCLLTHPVWWSEQGQSREDTLASVLKEHGSNGQRYVETEILNEDSGSVSELRAALQQGF